MPRFAIGRRAARSARPGRRPPGIVLAPASSAVPSCMNSAAVAIGSPSRSAKKQVAQARLNRAKPSMYGITSGCSLQPCADDLAVQLRLRAAFDLPHRQRRIRTRIRVVSVDRLIQHARQLHRLVAAARQRSKHIDAGQRTHFVRHRRSARAEEALDRVEIACRRAARCMPSPNVCVIGEPTPANIAEVPPTVFQIAPGVRIDPRLRVDERGIAASLGPLEAARQARSAKTLIHREAHMLPCRAMTMTRREAIGMLATVPPPELQGSSAARSPRRRRAPCFPRARSSARSSGTCRRKSCRARRCFTNICRCAIRSAPSRTFHRRRGADDRGERSSRRPTASRRSSTAATPT